MKGVVLFLCSLLAILTSVSSCEDKNINLTRKEFKKYVQKSFDNPKAMKEIVEIIPSDTISITKLRSKLIYTRDCGKEAVKASAKLDSIQQKVLKLDNINNQNLKNANYVTKTRLETLGTSLVLLKTMSIQSLIELIACENVIDEFLDSLEYEAPIYEYIINYRVERNKELKLEKQYAYVDSLKGLLRILPEQITTEDGCSKQMLDGINLSSFVSEKVDKMNGIIMKRHNNLEELQSILLQYMK